MQPIFTERFRESSIVHPVIVAQAAGKAPAKGPELLAELPYMDPTVLAIRHMNFTHGNHNQSKAIQIPRVNMIKCQSNEWSRGKENRSAKRMDPTDKKLKI